MRYSFIIPARNEQHRIPNCLRSIIEHGRGSDYEVIVVDNGSTDHTTSVAEQFGASVYELPAGSISKLRNLGAKKASGEVLIFIDADCAIATGYLDAIEKHFYGNAIGMVTGKIDIPSDCTWLQKVWALNRCVSSIVHLVDWASSMNMVVKKDVFNLCGGFDDAMTTCEDVDFCCRVRRSGYQILYDDRVCVVHYGEAPDLATLFKKERWRGKSLFRITFCRSHSAKELVLLSPFYLFLAGAVLFLCGLSTGDVNLLKLSMFGLLPMVVLRAALVSYKQSSVKYCLHLMVVWFVYYLARSVSIADGLIDYLMAGQIKK